MRLRPIPAFLASALILVAAAASAGVPSDDPRFDPALREILARPSAAAAAPGRPAAPFAALRSAAAAIPLSERHPDRPIPALLAAPGAVPDLRALGFTVVAEVDGAAAITGSEEAFARLAAEPGGWWARLSRPVEPSLDKGFDAIRGPLLRHGTAPDWSGPTGAGALVGIVDTGVDILHGDFRRPDGSSRVVAFWDQYASGQSSEVPVGQVYREEELALYLARQRVNPGGWDRVGHGTHVAGIAAGNGAAAGDGTPYRFVGVAPEADLVVVRTAFDEASVAAALAWVMAEAERRDRPIAVNLSLGNQYGPHDGTDPFEKLVSDMAGPGRQVVVAAGNQGGDDIHAFLPAGAGPDSVSLFVPPYAAGDEAHLMHFEGWTVPGAPVHATIVLPNGRRLGPISGSPQQFEQANYLIRSGTGDTGSSTYFYFEALVYGVPRVSGEWTLVIDTGTTPRPAMNFWIPLADFGGGPEPHFLRGLDPRSTLSPPANGRNVIAVSALVSKTCWPRRGASGETCFVTEQREGDLADFSSLGPTPDGRRKPEVAAPGFGVVSSLSSSMDPAVARALELPVYLDPDGVHFLNYGTSMSAPFATGALALLMSRIPDLTPAEAQARFLLGEPMAAAPGALGGHRLDLNAFASPIALSGLFEAQLREDRRVVLSWYPVPLRGEPTYRVTRALDGGAFDPVPGSDRRGRGPFELVDRPLEPGRTATYRLLAVDSVGVHETIGSVTVSDAGTPRVTLRLPPENPGAVPMRLSFFLPSVAGERSYRLRLFDVQGRPVRTLDAGTQAGAALERSVDWDGRSDAGRPAASGVYLVRLEAGRETRTLKVVLRR